MLIIWGGRDISPSSSYGSDIMNKNKIQTSKIILIIDILIAIALSGIVIYGVFFTERNLDPLTVIAGLWDAQLAVAIGFYYWKSKNENRSKHAMELVEKLADKYGIENVVTLAEVVLKD